MVIDYNRVARSTQRFVVPSLNLESNLCFGIGSRLEDLVVTSEVEVSIKQEKNQRPKHGKEQAQDQRVALTLRWHESRIRDVN